MRFRHCEGSTGKHNYGTLERGRVYHLRQSFEHAGKVRYRRVGSVVSRSARALAAPGVEVCHGLESVALLFITLLGERGPSGALRAALDKRAQPVHVDG